ncbi:MAG TPA: 6-carboxytetrahydropterin synthase QueD [Ignavibacteriaceae bacterium]|nr:6-carboxytetrahydropterin synthase QueD [Ignavibacteriaceae bacterium]
MRIAKEFNWEMGHRLPKHFGKCKNIHGHSYKMSVELEGEIDPNTGMIMDYYDVKKMVNPIVEELDHCFMVNSKDKDIIAFLEKVDSKKVVVDFDSTVENICMYMLNKIKQENFPSNIKKLKVRIFETYDDYAEAEVTL